MHGDMSAENTNTDVLYTLQICGDLPPTPFIHCIVVYACTYMI